MLPKCSGSNISQYETNNKTKEHGFSKDHLVSFRLKHMTVVNISETKNKAKPKLKPQRQVCLRDRLR